MSDDKLFDLFNESLRVVSTHCPVCNSRYNPIEAKVLAEKNDAHLVHITCQQCRSAILAVVLVSGTGISSIGLVTDLTSEDVLKFRDAGALTHDDVIDLHQFITKQKVLIDQFT